MEFADWLQQELDKRDWKQSNLIRFGINSGLLSRILNRERRPGADTCRKIARAFGIPAEDVMRYAGLLPPEPISTSSLTRKIDAELAVMTEAELETWLETLHAINAQKGRHGPIAPGMA